MSSQRKVIRQILVVDDSKLNREVLRDILEDEYSIIEASRGDVAVNILREYADSIALVLLDLNMPRMNGYEVLKIMNDESWIDSVPVIMISAESKKSIVAECYDLGATDYISRPFDETIVKKRVSNTIMLYAKQRKLQDMVAEQIMKNEKDNRLMIEILSHIVEFRNGESGDHIKHIHVLTEMLLERLVQVTDRYPLTPIDISLIGTASAMHDIGKISVPTEILNKPGRLTPEEFEIIKQHSTMGAEMLKSTSQFNSERLIQVAYEICRWHHERYDGKGYPDGLVGEDIPIAAQAVSVADVYDALTSERCYKVAFSHDKALEMILGGECGQFNPILLQCLKDIAPEIRVKASSDSMDQRNEDEIKMITKSIMGQKGALASAHKRLDSLVDDSLLKAID